MLEIFFDRSAHYQKKASSFQVALASVERIFSLLNREPEIVNISNPIIPPRLQGHIEFTNVWFAYDDDNWVIKDLSFVAKPGPVVLL